MSTRPLLLFLLLILISVPISTPAIDLGHAVVFDIPDDVAEKQFGRQPGFLLTDAQKAEIASYRFDGDTLKVLAVLVEWSNRPGTYSRKTIDSMLFSRGVYPGGSLTDYFDEVSYGQTAVTGDVIDWYNAGYYPGWFDFESILPALNAFIDFSQYDGDNDGNVDILVFVRAGTGQEDTGDPNDIWSYAYIYPLGYGPGPYDGVMIPRWNTSPELRPLRNPLYPPFFTGEDSLNLIRVFCHEMAHGLGLPDLYDYDAKLDTITYFTPNDDNDHPFIDWCLMGYAGYGLMSIRSRVPSHLTGWCKKELGWIEPTVLMGEHEDVVIKCIETNPDSSLYLLPINAYEGEYFLLEYRNPHSSGLFDKVDSDFSVYFWPDLTYGGDSLDRGLLITHVHDSLTLDSRINYGTPTYSHYSVAVEDAGYNPSRDLYTNPEGRLSDSAQWWYPYETRRAATFSSEVPGQEEFGPGTVPNSDGYSAPTGIVVRVDSIVGERLYAYVYNESFFDEDGDGVPAEIDNCAETYNPDQLDSNLDGIGDACPWLASCCEIRGDFDHNGRVDVADIVGWIGWSFGSGDPPVCVDPDNYYIECDMDTNGRIDVADLVFWINWSFHDGDPPPPCFSK